MVTTRSRVRRSDHLRHVRDNLLALREWALNGVGGSALLPGTARRAVYRLAGAKLSSAPGLRCTVVGDLRLLRIAEDVYINRDAFIEVVGPVSIGRDSSIGMQVTIVTSDHPADEHGQWSKKSSGRPVAIGERVWIGARATILPGAVIESDTVIAAGAVVIGHCRSRGVYAGVPARRIREYPEPTPAA